MALTSNVSNGMNFAFSDHGSARFCAPDGVDQVIELHDRNDRNFLINVIVFLLLLSELGTRKYFWRQMSTLSAGISS